MEQGFAARKMTDKTMLKKPQTLFSSRQNPQRTPEGTPPALPYWRPRWMVFLSIVNAQGRQLQHSMLSPESALCVLLNGPSDRLIALNDLALEDIHLLHSYINGILPVTYE